METSKLYKYLSMKTTELIAQLAIDHHAKAAYYKLFDMGFEVVPVAREGLHHKNASVRYYCCSLLDHFLIPEALQDLMGMVHDPDPDVRTMALHTLACDRCKEGDCRPAEADVLPQALQILKNDKDAHVRAMAIEVIGQYVHTNKRAEEALIEAKKGDSSPTVRKKAGWYAPGGPIHTRTLPHLARKIRH
jgi:HEAT repeat protein